MAMSTDRLVFPDGFLWGAATAAYQIEGAATEGGRGVSIWDTWSHIPGNTANGDTGDVAIDHYHRWRDDIGIMKEIGLQAYRFSIAWPRILPNGRGEINPEGLRFYSDLVDGLLEAGSQPWITLFHWDLPQVLDDEGGWASRDMLGAWDEYVDVVTTALGDRVKHWITINEPWVISHLGYNWGVMAPGRKDLKEALAVAHGLNLARGRAVNIVRRNVPDAKVGITLNLSHIYAGSDSLDDQRAADWQDGFSNRWFLDPVMKGSYPDDMWNFFGDAVPEIQRGDMELASVPTDFLGINTYNPQYVGHDPVAPNGVGQVETIFEKTSTDWIVDPQGFEDLLVRIQRDYNPGAIVVTENGSAWDDEVIGGTIHDSRRINYLRGHLNAAHRAIGQGVNLKGYFCWSLFDNYEWSQGYAKRFGITWVDYETQERIIKQSGRYYADVIASNSVEPE
jgi:beta-glucosidase